MCVLYRPRKREQALRLGREAMPSFFKASFCRSLLPPYVNISYRVFLLFIGFRPFIQNNIRALHYRGQSYKYGEQWLTFQNQDLAYF